ncbi:MAG: GNAT family N-acetyltransferase [Rhodospirillales bacterium]|nr:GNAT family N-acetyltransferase [Acetobacter sp.]
MMPFSLEDQSFVLRPLVQADVAKYQVFFNDLSVESVRCRFGHLLAKLTETEAARRTDGNTDGETAVAILDEPQQRIVAVGRCYLDGHGAQAEVALVVAEPLRRLGLGRVLLAQLIEVARNQKARSISAYIATQNAPVLRLLQSAGFVRQSAGHEDDLKLVLNVSP